MQTTATALPPPRQILRLCAFAFCLLASYAVARPASESLFLSAYSSRRLPLSWLALMGLVSLTVLVYMRLAERIPLPRLLRRALLVSGLSLTLLLIALRVKVPGAAFVLYLWKDTYIVVLLEIFWSLANLTTGTTGARWTYGLYCFMGSSGGLCANVAVGALAARIGTAAALLAILPLLLLCGLLSLGFTGIPAATQRPAGSREGQTPTPDTAAAQRLFSPSSYLGYLVALVAVIQVVLTLIDFQYNALLERAYTDTDARTLIIGRVYAAIDVASIALQLLTAPILRLGGVRLVLLGVPTLLSAVLAGGVVAPLLALGIAAKVTGKSLDYSLFRAAKEMLYIPLSYAGKTQGKALVDMLGYRVAKGAASLLLLALAALPSTSLSIDKLVSPLNLVLCAAWLGLTLRILQRYHQRLLG